MAINASLPEIFPSTLGGEVVQTVNARDLHVFLEIGKDFSSWVKTQIDRARLLENRDFLKLTQKGELSATGQFRTEYHLSVDAAKHIAMLSGTDKGFEVREYFIDCERRAKQHSALGLPDFSNPAAAARAWADQYEARLHAERTKAEIGSRREASAMATASNAVQKANRLEAELDKSKCYATIKRMEMLYHGVKFNWRKLKEAATHIGTPTIDVFDANYGTVKAYHADAWREAYALEILVPD